MKQLLLILLCIWNCLACKKDSNENAVPAVAVDIYLYTTDPLNVDLNVVGGWKHINGGVKGIIVYRLNNDEFMAYDRCCTYKPDLACEKVSVDPSNSVMAIDTCCKSTFVITDGSVVKGPATLPLKRYQCNFNGSVIHIYN